MSRKSWWRNMLIAKRQQRDNFGYKQVLRWSFCARGLGRDSWQTPFQPGRIFNIAIKSICTTEGALLPLLRRPVKNHRHLWSRNVMRTRRWVVQNLLVSRLLAEPRGSLFECCSRVTSRDWELARRLICPSTEDYNNWSPPLMNQIAVRSTDQ